MAQKPIKKIAVQKKPTKYKKALEKPKTDSQKVSKKINKKIVENFEEEHLKMPKVLSKAKKDPIKKKK